MMRRKLWPIALAAALGAADARAGSADAQAAVDVFHANDVNPKPEAGAPERIYAQEVGLNLRLRASELDDRLRFQLRYRGREPVLGDIQNEPLRTLWEGWASYAFLDGLVTTTAGRFFVPGPLFLVVDGAQVELELPFGLQAGAFGGRRGLTTARREAGFDKWLLAAGAHIGWRHELGEVALHANYAQDEGLFLVADDALSLDYGGFNLLARAFSRPVSWLFFGGQIGFVQQGNYVLGPTWTSLELETKVIDLWNGVLFGEWRPHKLVRLGYDLHYQRPLLVRVGTITGEGAAPARELVDPNFLDNRLRLAVSPFSVGWLRAGVRHRLRPERQELRYFGEVDLDRLIPFGFYTRAQLIYEQMIHDVAVVPPRELDRILGSAAIGYFGYGFDVSTGFSYIERSGSPLSGRVADAKEPEDLSPFVLEAQRILFLRAGYGSRHWFTNLNLERNIDDNDYRFFAQVGGNMELDW